MQNHKFLTAHFINNEKTTVEIQWESPEGEVIIVNTQTESDSHEWKNLLDHITIDQLHENTVAQIRQQREVFESVVKGIAEAEGLTFKNLAQDEAFDIIIDTITRKTDSESMFKFKLKMFDVPAVKECKDRTLKAEIRKAKTIAEVLAAFSKI